MKAGKFPYKIAGWILLGIFVLFIGVNLYFCTAGLPPWVKDQIVELMQKKFYRQVEIKKVAFCFSKGIVIRGVKISDRGKSLEAKNNIFFECDELVCKYDLIQALKKKFKIEKLTIEKPKIYVKKFKRGGKTVFNFSDLILPILKKQPKEIKKKNVEVKAAPSKPAKPVKKLEKKKLLPVELQIKKVKLKKALIKIIDTTTPGFREIYNISNITFLIENINLSRNSEMKITMGFGLNVTELKNGKKTDKDINLEAEILGKLKVFDKKGVINPFGRFNLVIKNSKLTGIQAYDELRNQTQDLNKTVEKAQKDLLKRLEQAVKGLKQAEKLSVSRKMDGMADKISKIDTSFIEGSLKFNFLKKRLKFDKITTILIIKNGKFITDDILIKTADFNIKGNGYTDIDTKVNYDMNLLLAGKYNTSEMTKAIANKDNKPGLPVKVRGTVSDMKVTIDKKTIRKRIETMLKKILQERIKEAIGGG